MRVEPLLAHVARDHVVRFRPLTEAEQLCGVACCDWHKGEGVGIDLCFDILFTTNCRLHARVLNCHTNRFLNSGSVCSSRAAALLLRRVLELGGLEKRDHVLVGGLFAIGGRHRRLLLLLGRRPVGLLLDAVLVWKSHIIDKVVVHLLCTIITQVSRSVKVYNIFFRLREPASPKPVTNPSRACQLSRLLG